MVARLWVTTMDVRFRVGLLAVFNLLLTHGQKFDPESLYEPI